MEDFTPLGRGSQSRAPRLPSLFMSSEASASLDMSSDGFTGVENGVYLEIFEVLLKNDKLKLPTIQIGLWVHILVMFQTLF